VGINNDMINIFIIICKKKINKKILGYSLILVLIAASVDA